MLRVIGGLLSGTALGLIGGAYLVPAIDNVFTQEQSRQASLQLSVQSTCNEDEVALWQTIGNGGWYCVKGHHVLGTSKTYDPNNR